MSAPVLDRARTTRARNGDLVAFAVNGFAFASWMSRIPDVRDLLSLTPGGLSLLLLAVSVGAVLGLPTAGRIAHRIGAANTVRLGMALLLPGVMWAAIASQAQLPVYLVAPGLFLLGLGSGIWDVAQNLEGTIIERAIDRAIMPWFHAGFSAGTVLAALLGAGMTALQVPLVAHIGGVVVVSLVAAAWGTAQFLPAFDEDSDQAVADDGKARSAWTEPRTLLIGLIVLAAAFAEGTANDWLAVAFVDGHHLDKAMGVVALAVFLSFMTAGRILGTVLLDRYGRVAVLRVLFAAAIVGCLLVVFGGPVLAFVGAAVWGVGASLGFPVGMSAAADDPARAPMRISVVATIGYTAFLAGPPLLGFLGDHFGILRALLVVGVASVAAMLVIPVAKPPADSTPVGE
ncbi:MAG: MFS transporter [Propionibacteriaceae bacterium]|nr:MFS transporter [Propionibacteriaceae bacterium]